MARWGQECDTDLLGGSRVSSQDKRTLGEGGVNGEDSKTPCEWIDGGVVVNIEDCCCSCWAYVGDMFGVLGAAKSEGLCIPLGGWYSYFWL